MSTASPSAIAIHVEDAKRLLRELEQQAHTAISALGRENSSEFFSAVEERGRILGQLDHVVTALTNERGAAADAEISSLFMEIAHAAARALELHERLATETRRESDLLAPSLRRTRMNSVVPPFAAARPRTRKISITR
jgi:hypothetical protein